MSWQSFGSSSVLSLAFHEDNEKTSLTLFPLLSPYVFLCYHPLSSSANDPLFLCSRRLPLLSPDDFLSRLPLRFELHSRSSRGSTSLPFCFEFHSDIFVFGIRPSFCMLIMKVPLLLPGSGPRQKRLVLLARGPGPDADGARRSQDVPGHRSGELALPTPTAGTGSVSAERCNRNEFYARKAIQPQRTKYCKHNRQFGHHSLVPKCFGVGERPLWFGRQGGAFLFTVFTREQVAPKHKTHPSFCHDFLVPLKQQ